MSDPMRTRLIRVSEEEALSITWYCLDGTEHHQLITCPPRATREAARQQIWDNPTNPKHGVDCPKRFHDPIRTGYLHGPDDDTPYDVDGVSYCGRCHRVL